jgi:transcriptional regulator with XRE-family HTH domain
MAVQKENQREDREMLRRRRELIGRRVQQLRVRFGWRQQDLVSRAQVTANTVRALENGTAKTQWRNLVKVAKALETTPDLLTANTENDLALAWLHPQLRDLVEEDLSVAHLFHTATIPTREYVRYLLQRDQGTAGPRPTTIATHLVERVADLSPRGQEAIEQVLHQFEQYERRRKKDEDVLSSAS